MPRRPLAALLAALALAAPARAEVDFVRDVQPILVDYCLKCHRPDFAEADYRVDTLEQAAIDDIIVPGDPDDSEFIRLIELSPTHKSIMPPKEEENPMSAEQIKTLRDWVDQGAKWPEGIVLEMPPIVDFKRDVEPILDKLTEEERRVLKLWINSGAEWPSGSSAAEMELVTRLREKITAGSPERAAGDMADYDAEVPATGVPYSMVAVQGGEFTMGGDGGEAAPARRVKVSPFWIGKHEVTWDEYEPFMLEGGRRNKDGSLMFPPEGTPDTDLISRPTKPYVEMTFGMGKEGFPAISMTQHAALMYCKWLSAQTGHFYRLPTEAEWEYACRAGTDTRWSFGDDESQLPNYAWYIDNADFCYQQVGKKKPNPWGIHDMHGNVAEWTLDIFAPYDPDQTEDPWARGRDLYPRAVRGGSWNDDPEGTVSTARFGSRKEWKKDDPQLPKSIWYHTDAQWLGFRIVRPLEVPSAEEMNAYWNTGIDHDTLE